MDMGHHLVLPIVTLVVISVGSLMRYTRTNMLEVLNADFIRTARAKGLSERKVIYHHAFRNTLIPLVTIIGGSLPGLFSGALITETLYSIPGIGYISYQSMVGGDIPFSMFYLVFMAVLTLLGNLNSVRRGRPAGTHRLRMEEERKWQIAKITSMSSRLSSRLSRSSARRFARK